VAPNPDRELAEARAAIDRSDARGALKRLDRARRGYVKRQDTDGLEHLLLLTDLVDPTDERTRIGCVNLDYAIKQNLRQESRREALQGGRPWVDPYPGLEAPTEHTGIAFTRGVKAAIAIGTALGAAALVGFLVLSIFFSASTSEVTLRLVNDTHGKANVSGCDDPSCFSTWMHADLDPGLTTERDVPTDDLVDVFQFHQGGHDLCLPLRIHDAFVRHGSDTSVVLVGRLSRATPCPGSTVLPGAAPQTGL
jgi:hypothetical protein